MNKNIELLAPVGGIKQFFAAVENGADAVYLGGKRFNARMKAESFDAEQLKEAIRYAHLRNVKVYITVNILLSDDELSAAAAYCTALYNMGADALIVQDLGLANWVNTNLPDFPLHLSTQGTIYNLSGVQAAESLGFSRVVLARETSLEEVKKIRQSSDMEIEMFVHGALCMCYSGQCQMSRTIGGINGRSGNRGLCAQPCRLPYSESGGKKNGEQYPLSPKDLCTIDYLGEIIDAGVTSLKIEGRMKSPEYVAIVTRIYRKYLDEYIEKGEYHVLDEDRESLRQIYSRGEFTTGYLFDNPKEKLLTEDIPKHHGIYVGKVVGVPNNKYLIDVELSEPLEMGDYIEIRSASFVGSLVTYIEKTGDKTFRIGDIKKSVKKGDSIYRITKASLNKDAQKTYDEAGFAEGKNYKRVPVDLDFTLKIDEHPTLVVREGDVSFAYTDDYLVGSEAINKPLEPALAERQLRKTGNTCFEANVVSVDIEKNCTLKMSAINKIRRDALEAYSNKKAEVARAVASPNSNHNVDSSVGSDFNSEKSLAFYLYDTEQLKTYDFKTKMNLLGVENASIYLPLEKYMQSPSLPSYLTPIPYISNISKGNLDKYIEENFEQIVDTVKHTGILIGNLGWCREFLARGVTVYADYGLNLNNETAKGVVKSFGITPVCTSLEAQDDAGWPIMITEHPLDFDKMVDRKGQTYKTAKVASGDKWMLFKESSGLNDKYLKDQWAKATGEYRIYLSE